MKFLNSLFFIIPILLLESCSTDFEVNAPRDETPVIFGLIDASVDTQFVKISKTFLGDGSILDFAQVRDSSEYQEKLNAYLIRTKTNDTLFLDTITLTGKETGQFYSGKTTAYYSTEKVFEEEEYAIEVFASDKKVSAVTNTIGEIYVGNPRQSQRQPVNMMGNKNAPWEYKDMKLEWTTTENVILVEARLIFRYEEFYNNGDPTVIKTFKYLIGSKRASSGLGNETILLTWNSERFFERLSTIETPAHVTKRVPLDLSAAYLPFDYEFTIAGEEINTYMELQTPSTGIVQQRPQYTNIVNGLGIFSSRYVYTLEDYPIHENTMNALLPSGGVSYTTDLKFAAN